MFLHPIKAKSLAEVLTRMKEAKEKILLVLADQMKEQGLDPTKFDPFKTPFKANSSGFDKMLDLVKIQADTSGQMKLTNKATGEETAITKAEKPTDMSAKKMLPPDPKLLTMDFSKVKNLVSGMNKLMGTSNPSADAFKEFVDVDFLSNGKTFATFTEMVSKESGTTLAGFVFGPCNPDTYVCDGTVALIQKGGAMKQELMPVKYDNKNATWKFYGNQRKVGFDLDPNIIIDVTVKFNKTNNTFTPTPVVKQGFELNIENQNESYLSAELWMGIKAKDGTDFSYTLITTYEKSNHGCYQLVLPDLLRSSKDFCDHFLPYETLATQAKKTNDEIKAAYTEGRMKFKISVTPVSGTKFDIPPFRPTFIEIKKDDENFKKMLDSKFISSELGSTSITMPKGVDLEWVGFYLYNSTKQLNTVENIYLDSEGQNSFKSLGDTITSEEICTAAAKNIGTENLTCSKSDLITSIFWKFRDPMGSELKITYGYHLTAE
jgi:hypothetical protein